METVIKGGHTIYRSNKYNANYPITLPLQGVVTPALEDLELFLALYPR